MQVCVREDYNLYYEETTYILKGVYVAMFKKRLEFDIIQAELVRLMRVIGKYGVKFRLGKLDNYIEKSNGKRLYFYHVCIYTSRRKLKKIQTDIKNSYEYWLY